jgi:hypothetical protein
MSTQETPNPNNVINAEDVLANNPTLQETPEADTELKEWLIGYVGSQQQPEDGNVTVEMIVETMATEFPEFLMAIAEENWVRGYYQAMIDVEEGTKAIREAVTTGRSQNANQEVEFNDEQNGQTPSTTGT